MNAYQIACRVTDTVYPGLAASDTRPDPLIGPRAISTSGFPC
jgi:hypothetical protein